METKEIIQIALIALAVYLIMGCISHVKEGFNRFAALSGANNLVLTDAEGNMSSIQFPKGMIMLWKGSLSNIPEGWALCDGTQDTPDLRGRFVMGVNPSDNKNNLTARPMGTIGGSETHTLTPEQMPPHTHKSDITNWGGGQENWPTGGNWGQNNQVQSRVTSSSGGGQPHPIIPPYYSLAYIMKL